MDRSLSRKLQVVQNISEKAALVAEAILNDLPKNLAYVVRCCILLHWFDLSIVKALLQEVTHDKDEIANLSIQISEVSFIETVSSGFAIQNVTRTGLLDLYERTQPDLLRKTAQIAAPLYATHQFHNRFLNEAFFCHLVAGNQKDCISIFTRLLTQAIRYEDVSFAETLFALQTEAEKLSFVKPLALSAEQTYLRDLAYGMQIGQKIDQTYQPQQEETKKQAMEQTHHGMRAATLHRLIEAREYYSKALHLMPGLMQARIARAITQMALYEYEDACNDFSAIIQLLPDNLFILQQQGTTLLADMRYQDALSTYEHILELDADYVTAYTGKGKALFELKRYEEGLTAYEYSTFLEARSPEAFFGKGQCLYNLKQYTEAQTNFDTAKSLTTSPLHTEEQEAIVKALQENKTITQTALHGSKNISRAAHKRQKRKMSPIMTFFASISFLILLFILMLPFLFHHKPGETWPINLGTPSSIPQTSPLSTVSLTPQPEGLNPQRTRIMLSINDPVMLINGNQQEIDNIKQQLRSNTILNNHKVAIAIAYDGAPTPNDIPQAQKVSQKLYQILGQEGGNFQKAAFYDPLYVLGYDSTKAILDVYFFLSSSQPSLYPLHYRSLTLHNIDTPGLINNTPSARNNLKQTLRSRPEFQKYEIAFVIIYAGAPTASDITQAQSLCNKVTSVMSELGSENFAFQRTSYYDPLYLLGYLPSDIIIHFYSFNTQ